MNIIILRELHCLIKNELNIVLNFIKQLNIHNLPFLTSLYMINICRCKNLAQNSEHEGCPLIFRQL